ncbi:hypothetical protein ONZ45_g7679 [Pleurotus djamor]|nr:hypothetical protein ONZ45_g7679 [Pleurotus djamor]
MSTAPVLASGTNDGPEITVETNHHPHYPSTPTETGPVYAEQKRDEVAKFNMDQHRFTPFADCTALLTVLKEAGDIPAKPANMTVGFPSLKLFIKCLNKACRIVRDNCFANQELMVASDTECQKLKHHPTSTDCRPDITLAFKSRWGKLRSKKSIPWSWAELVGEKTSAGCVDPLLKAASYAYYWLLSRPDRLVALSFLTAESGITFLVAFQGSSSTRILYLPWGSDLITELIYAFVYRLYSPGNWANPHFTKKVTENDAVFDIKVNDIPYEDFKPLFASNPFRTRTHVLFNLNHSSAVQVIKSQLSRKSRRFVEREIYQHIRRDGDVPGIPHVLHFFDVEVALNPTRTLHIIALKEYGRPIMMAVTLLDTLEILYDILEIMRYLYDRHDVLHRDISKGNILFLTESVVPPGQIPTDHGGLCFIRHLLDSEKHRHPHETRAMLIDFNNSEIIGEKTDAEDPDGKKRTVWAVYHFYELYGKQPELIPEFAWYAFIGNWKARNKFIASGMDEDPFHSFFAPAAVLVEGVASVVAPDRSWLSEQDPRNHPDCALEGFQRLILSFVLQNKDEDFMRQPVKLTFTRDLGDESRSLAPSCTPALMSFSEGLEERAQKRKSGTTEENASQSKKPRHEEDGVTADATSDHDHGNAHDADDEDDDEDDGVEDVSVGQDQPPDGPAEDWEKLEYGQQLVLNMNVKRKIRCFRSVLPAERD